MSRSQSTSRLADEQTAPGVSQIKSAAQRQAEATQATEQAISRLSETISQADQSMSRAESNQTELMQLVERSARDLTDLIEESKQTMEQYRNKTSQASVDLRRTIEETRTAAKGIQQSTETISKQAAERITKQTKKLDQTARRLRWTLMGMMMLTGSVIGVGLLMLLLIWQPDLTAQIWQISQ